jgi:hypothetical protein
MYLPRYAYFGVAEEANCHSLRMTKPHAVAANYPELVCFMKSDRPLGTYFFGIAREVDCSSSYV